MSAAVMKYLYPENAYCVIFGRLEHVDIPADAEETLEYVMGTLTAREADIFRLCFKYEMTYAEIGKKYNLTKQHVQHIISAAIRKLSHSSRSEILAVGREEYLNSVVAATEEEKKRYYERICELESLIRKQCEKPPVYITIPINRQTLNPNLLSI